MTPEIFAVQDALIRKLQARVTELELGEVFPVSDGFVAAGWLSQKGEKSFIQHQDIPAQMRENLTREGWKFTRLYKKEKSHDSDERAEACCAHTPHG